MAYLLCGESGVLQVYVQFFLHTLPPHIAAVGRVHVFGECAEVHGKREKGNGESKNAYAL